MTSLCYESIQWSPLIEDRTVDLIAPVRAAATAGVEIMSRTLRSLSYDEFAQQAPDAAEPYWR